jgi:Ran-binding protein 1
MNHIVHPDVDLKANAGSDRSWTWRCTDYAGDAPDPQTFAIRFKDADTAQAFKTKFDEVRKINDEIIKKETATKKE